MILIRELEETLDDTKDETIAIIELAIDIAENKENVTSLTRLEYEKFKSYVKKHENQIFTPIELKLLKMGTDFCPWKPDGKENGEDTMSRNSVFNQLGTFVESANKQKYKEISENLHRWKKELQHVYSSLPKELEGSISAMKTAPHVDLPT